MRRFASRAITMRPITMSSGRSWELLHTASVIMLEIVLSAFVVWEVHAAEGITVSQKERTFNPNHLTIKRGDTVHIVNDDGELIHHAYVATDTFSFDSGEQDPGSTTDIRFTADGTFTVRCRIHPKMALVVNVER